MGGRRARVGSAAARGTHKAAGGGGGCGCQPALACTRAAPSAAAAATGGLQPCGCVRDGGQPGQQRRRMRLHGGGQRAENPRAAAGHLRQQRQKERQGE